MNADATPPRALIIDDEPFMRKVMALQLQSLGCQDVVCHASGEDALLALQHSADTVDLVLCDLQMPTMDGVEVVRRLGAMAFRGALILVSGEDRRTLSMAEKLAHAHGLHILGALSKPVQADLLKGLLSKLATEAIPAALPRQVRLVDANDLARGIVNGELVNHYQPKVCMHTGRVMGMESLVRWQHPEHGLVYPDAFISVAEEQGLIDQLTHAVIAGPHGVLKQLKQWLDVGLTMHVAVNVSMYNLHDLNFPDVLAKAAQEAGVGLGHLVLEITESRLNTDMRSVTDILTRLRLKRLRLSIDDFGTGYSSLAQLHDLPFDELKIDRLFVHKAYSDRALDSILEASINMASDLGMQVTAEGVETEEDWCHLQLKGCDVAQGYWIARPMSPELILPWINDWNSRVHTLPGVSTDTAQGGLS